MSEPSKVRVVAPDGTTGTIDASELEAALRQGFKQPVEQFAPDIVSETGNAIGTGVLGAVSGATAGLSDIALSKDATTRQFVRAQKEQNPTANLVGEIAGSLVSPLNEVGSVVEGAKAATAAGRLGQKVVGGVAVGSLYGAGNAVSDAALGDTQLTAEKLASSIGLGALLGGLGGGVGGAIEEGAAKVLPKLATVIKGGQSTLDDVADHATLKAFRNTAKELRKYSDADIEDAVNVVRERGHLKLSPEAIEKSVASDAEGVGATKGAFLDAADKTSRPDFAAALRGLDEHAAGLSPLEREAIAPSLKKARTALEDIATDPKTGTWRAFDKWKQDLQAAAKFSRGAAEDDLALGLKRRLAGFARSELDRQLVPALGDQGQAFLDTKKLYGSLKTAERLAGTGAGRGTGFSLVDIASSVGLGGVHPFGLIGGLGTKLLREHGAAIVAQVADRLAKSPAMKAVAASFAKTLPGTAPKLGRYGPSLLLAARRSPELALAQHMVTAQVDPEYAANAQLAGLRPESPQEHVAALGKATDIAAIHAAMKAHEEAVDEAMQHVVKGTKPPARSPVLKTQEFGAKQLRRDSRAAHAHIVGQIRQLASNPQALVDRVASNTAALGNAAPGVTSHMTAVADRAVKYLAAQCEEPTKPGPMAAERVPTESERHVFALKLEAVQEPMSVLHSAAHGTLTRTQLQAVAEVHPAFMDSLKTKALEQMVSGEKMSYQARMMLSLIAGVDADGTLSPKAIAANQNAIAAAGNAPSGEAGEDKTKLGIASRAATPGEKKELQQEAS